jgi:ATP-binding cassette subfamily B protein
MRISRLFPYLVRHRTALGIGVLAIIAGDLLLLLGPWWLRRGIDALEAGQLAETRRAALMLLLFVGVGGAFKYVMRRWMIGASREIEYELRRDFAAHAFSLSPSWYDRHKVGELMALATNDLNAIRMILGPGIMYLVNTAVTLVVALSLMLAMSPKLTLLAFLPLPLLALSVQQGSRLTYQRFSRVQEQFATITALAQEAFTGIRVVKSYAREKLLGERFGARSEEYVQLNMSYFQVQALMYPMMGFLAGLAAAVTLYFGGKMAVQGVLSVGTLVAFLAYLGQLTWPVIALGWTINLWQRGLASLDRMGTVFDARPEIVEAAQPIAWTQRRGEIEFRGVSFAYPGSVRLSLSQLNLRILPGTLNAVVGATGCGKTTLLRLLMRQYDAYEGEILLDGLDLRQVRLADLRAGMSMAPQDGFLFSDTLRENIAFGRPELSDFDLERMAEQSRLARDREHFPHGWDTLVGERGVTLSGGQRQRVGIARALASDPVLLLLDDVFSSVDTQTEAELLAQLRQAWSGRTVILVTHRLLAVQDADQILVLDDGSLVEVGRHEELVARGGVYERLFRRQLAEAELDALGDGA